MPSGSMFAAACLLSATLVLAKEAKFTCKFKDEAQCNTCCDVKEDPDPTNDIGTRDYGHKQWRFLCMDECMEFPVDRSYLDAFLTGSDKSSLQDAEYFNLKSMEHDTHDARWGIPHHHHRLAHHRGDLHQSPIMFYETFGKSWASRWTMSKWKESEGTQGTFNRSVGKYHRTEISNVVNTEDGKEYAIDPAPYDLGLHTTADMMHYTASTVVKPFTYEGKVLVVTFVVKYEKDVDCGGGYIKLGPTIDDPTMFGDPTPYNIMFGPDKCGHTKRTHLIFNYKGKNILKKVDLPYKQDDVGISHLYTLIVYPDNTVRVEIDMEKIYEGSLKEDWEMLEPKEIHDPQDKKPEAWVDEAMMDDPEGKKPADWVEEKRIADPDATKPSDWDDEEDGEWEAPMKDNDAYKGEWYNKRISNPEYKGVWEAKKIANPDFVDDDMLYHYDNFGFMGIDLWQVKSGTIFDNIAVYTADAADFAFRGIRDARYFWCAWKLRNAAEQAAKKKDEEEKAASKKKDEELNAAAAAAAPKEGDAEGGAAAGSEEM